jgi:hypothetical protein
MWANRSSTLRADPPDETGRRTPLEGQPRTIGSTAPHQFRWSPDAVRRLDEDIEWALTSNPTGTAEIAGVLLGKFGPTIEITDCQPLLLMQPTDHAYALAGPGRDEFERTIAACQSIPEGKCSVIGFYRSQMENVPDLTEEDLGLIRGCFPNSNPLVLLIQRTANGLSSAKLFSGEQPEVLCQFQPSEHPSALPSWLELWHSLSGESATDTAVSNTAAPLDANEPTQIIEPKDPGTEYPPILATREAQRTSVPLDRHLNRSPVFLLAALLVLAILTGYLTLRGSARAKQGINNPSPAARDLASGSSQPGGLALRAERYGDDLRLDWNRTAPVLAGATGGMLTIREGNGQEKQVMLDGNLLRTGAVVYRPVHGDVSLRLVIFGQEGAKMGEAVSSYPQRMPISGSDAHKEKQ